jgi:hypothetical protein
MERSLLLFRESIKTKVTFQVYQRRLQEFMRFCNVSSFDELTQVTNLQESLEDYIIEKKQSISPNSVPNYFWPIKTFCESNEIELRWKKIQRFFPSKVKTGGKRPYTTKDIQDPDGLFSSVELSTQEVGDKLELTFDIVFEKPMPKKDIILVAWDFKRDRVQTTLLDAWEVVENRNATQAEVLDKEIIQSEEETEEIVTPISEITIPSWIKNNASWWSDGTINDEAFVQGIKYLITEEIMTIPQTESGEYTENDIPPWIKNNAGWWAEDEIDDETFVQAIQYLITNGILAV